MIVIKRMENKLRIIPFETISGIVKYPDPKTTAFGGVATGSMKAHEAATEAPTIKPNG